MFVWLGSISSSLQLFKFELPASYSNAADDDDDDVDVDVHADVVVPGRPSASEMIFAAALAKLGNVDKIQIPAGSLASSVQHLHNQVTK